MLIETKPQVGDIKKGREIGKVARHNNYIWARCDGCRKEFKIQ